MLRKKIKNFIAIVYDVFILFKVRNIFLRKSICLVGGHPSIIGKGLGTYIDQHDIVVRFNFPSRSNVYDLGERLDIRFIGATLLDKHDELIKSIHNELVFSTKKNKNKLGGITNVAFSKSFSKSITKLFVLKYGKTLSLDDFEKPPRSGVIFLMSLILLGNYKKISLCGFSFGDEGALSCYGLCESNDVVAYDKDKHSMNHCSVSQEVEILNKISTFEKVKAIK